MSVTGYIFGSGGTLYSSARSVTCDSGYLGAPNDIVCQSDGTWSEASGCTLVDCGEPAQVTGYVIDSGDTIMSSTRSVTCDIGYTGTPSDIECQSNAEWGFVSGCSIVNCGAPGSQTGYTFASGYNTYGTYRDTSCASGYSGTPNDIVCQADGSWSVASGCSVTCDNSAFRTCHTGVYNGDDHTTCLSDTDGGNYASACANSDGSNSGACWRYAEALYACFVDNNCVPQEVHYPPQQDLYDT